MIKERTIIGLEEMQTAVVAATAARNLQSQVMFNEPPVSRRSLTRRLQDNRVQPWWWRWRDLMGPSSVYGSGIGTN